MPVARASRASISIVGIVPPLSMRAIDDWVVPIRRASFHLREAGAATHPVGQLGESASKHHRRACLVIGLMVRNRVLGLEFFQRHPCHQLPLASWLALIASRARITSRCSGPASMRVATWSSRD